MRLASGAFTVGGICLHAAAAAWHAWVGWELPASLLTLPGAALFQNNVSWHVSCDDACL
jgi:hypothetical protein